MLGAAALPPSALALDPTREVSQYVHRRWGIEDGLPSLSIQPVAQTPDGYLWVGTTEGLARFDGFRFEVFDRSNTPEFALNEIRSLFVDSRGTLWIGFHDIGIARYAGGRFTAFRQTDLTIGGFAEHQGKLLALTQKGLFELRDGALSPAAGLPAELARAPLCRLLPDGGVLWVLACSGEIWRIGERADKVREATRGPLPQFVDLARTASGPLLLTPTSLEAWDGERFVPRPSPGGVAQLARRLLVDRDGNVWLPAGGNVLARLRDGRVSTIGPRDGLDANRVIDLVEDRDGQIWISTWDDGLHCLSDGPLRSYTTRQGLSNDYVRTVYADERGTVWIGTVQGLNRLDAAGLGPAGESILGGLWIYSLGRAPDGRLAVGTREHGVYLLGPDGRPRPAGVRFPSENWVFSLLGEPGGLWIGTGSSLFRWTAAGADSFASVEHPVFAMHRDRRGSVWFGTGGGLLERRPDGTLEKHRTATEPLHELVMSIHEDSRGDLWFGTLEGGINRLHDGRFTLFRKSDGLFDDSAWAILEDDVGGLWISCAKGLYRLALADVDAYEAGTLPKLRYRSFGAEDGLATRQFEGGNGNAGFRAPDGKLWFATLKGAAVVDPEAVTTPPPPPALVERALVDGDSQPAGALTVPAGRHRLEVEYTAIHLRAPSKLRFRYRLAGFDRRWLEAGERRRAEYAGVPGGTYTFEVAASLDGETWGEPARLPLRVAVFWYQRASVQIAAALCLFALGAFLYRLRLRQIRRRDLETKAALEELVDFGKAVSGLLDPDEVLARLDRAITARWGDVWRGAVARREGRPPLAFERPPSAFTTPIALEAALAELPQWTAPRRLERASGGPLPTLAGLLRRAGAAAAAPMLSGQTPFGVVAIAAREAHPLHADRELAHLAGLAAQTAVALEGAWQAQEALHWRHLSEARSAWAELDRLSRLVFAAVAREGFERTVTDDAITAALVEVTGTPTGDWAARVRSTIDALLERGALRREPDGALQVAEQDWLLLPEVRQPLREIARRSGGRIGAYVLGDRLGAGGMGEVFRATNVHDGSEAAVKLLYAEESADPRARRRFEREGKIVAGLRHPNVVHFLERGEHEGRLYIAMELLRGEPLSRVLDRGPLLEAEVLRAARQLASALAELHRNAVVHRDIKTSNIMVEPDGRYVLLDLGVARGPLHSTLTQRNAAIGTLPYMSPEQLRGEEADERSDLWSLGVVLCEMALGRLPWSAEGTMLMALEILRTGSVPGHALDDLPPLLREIVASLLVTERGGRLASAALLERRLEEAVAPPDGSPPESWPGETRESREPS